MHFPVRHVRSKYLAALISVGLLTVNGCQKTPVTEVGAARHHRIALSKLDKAPVHGQQPYASGSWEYPGGNAPKTSNPDLAANATSKFAQRFQQGNEQIAFQGQSPQPQVNQPVWEPANSNASGNLPMRSPEGGVNQPFYQNANQHFQLQQSERGNDPQDNRAYEVYKPVDTHKSQAQDGWHEPLDRAMRAQWQKMTDAEKAAVERLLAGTFSLRPITAKQKPDDEHLLKLMTSLKTALAQGKQLTPELIQSISQASVGKRPFRIRRAEVCKRVRSYGVYEPFESLTFVTGQNQPMIIYAEIDDFHVVDTEKQMKEVLLEQSVALYNEVDGLKVWAEKPVQIRDHSRNKRRDFFVVQKVTIPANLTVGRYRLKVTMQDVHGRQFDEISIPLTMVAQPVLTRQPVTTSQANSTYPGAPGLSKDFRMNSGNNLLPQFNKPSRPSHVRELPLGYSSASLSDSNQ